jgi:hypothetical protein
LSDPMLLLTLKALEAGPRQERLYSDAASSGGGSIPFEIAVKIAAGRLADVVQTGSNSLGHRFLVGLLHAQKEYGFGTDTWNKAALRKMVEDAKTDYLAYLALHLIALVCRDEPIIREWQTLQLLGDPPRRKRGPSPYDNSHRDRLIIAEIERLEKFGFRPTRNRETENPQSGCDVISAALEVLDKRISYEAVASIWSRRNKMPDLSFLGRAVLKDFL